MKITKITFWIAIFLLSFGLIAFLKPFSVNHKVFGLFKVNLEQEVLFIGSGLIALLSSFTKSRFCGMFYSTFGIVFALIAIWGLLLGDSLAWGLFAVNTATAYLQGLIACLFIFLYFYRKF